MAKSTSHDRQVILENCEKIMDACQGDVPAAELGASSKPAAGKIRSDGSAQLLTLRRKGYAFIRRMCPNTPTIDIASSLGKVLGIEAQYPRMGVATVQVLRPHRRSDAKRYQFSGTYGLDEFPLHTDLAHWANPPHYTLLRCLQGSSSVATQLLHCSSIEADLDTATLRQALARPRGIGLGRVLSLLPLRFDLPGDDWGMRWDPLSLVPMNRSCIRVAETVNTHKWKRSDLTSVVLVDRGDTLVIDNFRCLHGRTSVPISDIGRQIERVYLNEVHI